MKNMGVKPTLLFLLLMAGATSSKASCDFPKKTVTAVHFLQEEDCALAKDLVETIDDVASELTDAPRVALVIGGVPDNASFDNGHVIQVPYGMKFTDRMGQAYQSYLSSVFIALAHEYGHAIFLKSIKTRFSDSFGEVFDELEKESQLRENAAQKKKKDPLLQADFEKLMKNPKFQEFNRLMTPYSEFFADCVAVFHFRDKEAIVKSLYYDEMSNREFQYLKMRNFDGDPDPRYSIFLSEEHSKLAYARSFVGRKLWPQEKSQIQDAENKIMTAIQNVTWQYLQQGRSEIDATTANQDLIKALN